ncbi:MAG TPA: DEAD/DEAH box helicase family protein, partial [Fibrobacteria bacterium]|nr:DEAD/DEAH box helicase family protein [Fibrobacteria bacterium]
MSSAAELKVLVLLGGGMPQAYWYGAGDISESALRPGTVVEVPLRNRQSPGIVIETGTPELAFSVKPVTRVAPDGARVSEEWISLLRWISSYYLTPLPLVLQAALPKIATRFLFHPPKRVVKRKDAESFSETNEAHSSAYPPTPEQRVAIDRLSEAMDAGSAKTFLLHGITGSGKTLVYLHLAKRALEA